MSEKGINRIKNIIDNKSKVLKLMIGSTHQNLFIYWKIIYTVKMYVKKGGGKS